MKKSHQRNNRGAGFAAGALLCLTPLGAAVYAANSNEPIQPLPQVQLDAAKVELGKRLFHDSRLSKDNTLSCASCHSLDKGGTDQSRVSTGVGGAKGPINAPTVLNSGFNFRQFWDGRADTLEDQAAGPVHNPIEMASNWPEVIGKLGQDPHYPNDFAKLYPDGIQGKNIQDAIATFERSLTTPSRFDDYLNGDANAITAEEKQGYENFKKYGCIACHQGTNVGGNMYQYFGVMGDYFKDRGNETKADLGRYNVTGKEEDRHKFKVPSLRNIALTAPYFHDGSAQTLDDAVKIMVKYQLGRTVPEAERALIIKFLQSLTGKQNVGSPGLTEVAKITAKGGKS
ncbi:MAG: cytochrome-c peroxidase [Gammaproteobacteria bacterium]